MFWCCAKWFNNVGGVTQQLRFTLGCVLSCSALDHAVGQEKEKKKEWTCFVAQGGKYAVPQTRCIRWHRFNTIPTWVEAQDGPALEANDDHIDFSEGCERWDIMSQYNCESCADKHTTGNAKLESPDRELRADNSGHFQLLLTFWECLASRTVSCRSPYFEQPIKWVEQEAPNRLSVSWFWSTASGCQVAVRRLASVRRSLFKR